MIKEKELNKMTIDELDEWLSKKEAEHEEYDRQKKKDKERIERLIRVFQKERMIEIEKLQEEQRIGRFMVHEKRFVYF